MCAIAGIISSTGSDASALYRCGAAMRHRGPDSEGVVQRGAAALMFRRLAIIDLSEDGNQPMKNEAADIWVVFNGEIYNYAALRDELKPHHHFQSRTDTEVLLHGYEQWGFDELLRRIDGMFAFAIWDERRKELRFARDRVGKKPLYYAETAAGFAFASTLNGLLELLPTRPAVDPVALDEYLVYQAIPAPRTIYSGVRMLMPAHCAVWSAETGLKHSRYWRLSYAKKISRSEPDLLAELDHLVSDAVRKRLVSDVPLGAFLSGGVDSSLIVGVMSALGAAPVEAVHAAFVDPAFDERPHARAVASKWGARLHEHLIDPDEVRRLPEIVWHYGQPLADVSIVPTFAVARAAKEHVTVVLNGDGGDEAFAGYARPVVARAAQMFRSTVPVRLRGMSSRLVARAGRKGRMLAQAARLSAREAFTYDRGFRGIRQQAYAPEFLESLESADPDEHYREIWDSAEGPTDADRALYGEFTTYLPDQLLVKMDVSTMSHSVEARSPLLDTRLLEFAASIPSWQLTRGFQTKYLLKRLAERYVPHHVIYRRKQGFVIPASRWLRADLARIARGVLTSDVARGRSIFRTREIQKMLDEHVAGVADWGNVLWTALVLEIWHMLFVDRSLSPTDRLEVPV